MINKQLALSLVQKAKAAHLKWRVYAQCLVEGLDCPQDSAPLLSTECEFGKWYYNQGKQMLGELTFYRALEPPHETLHALYGRIHHLVEQGKLDEARKHMPGLIGISETLLETIAFLEEEIASLPPRPHR
ncbi:MAG: CZB domain-containing protein [Sulfuricella sp.]|nr:CZB domain-containing protein [Sulfuricella sp.]